MKSLHYKMLSDAEKELVLAGHVRKRLGKLDEDGLLDRTRPFVELATST